MSVRIEPPGHHESFYIVGCRPSGSECTQEPFLWRPHDQKVMGGRGTWLVTAFPDSVEGLRVVGAPVIDLEGRVIGTVVEQFRQPDGRLSFTWEELRLGLEAQ